MKGRFLLTGFAIALMFNEGIAQAPDSTLTEKYLLDFVVPDIPAFKALGTDPSNILRPADPKKFAVSLSPFYSNGSGVIPKNFAVEFSPWKLASTKWTLKEYNEKRIKQFLYRSSFSIGAVEDSTEFPNKLAIGYRVSFLSKKADILSLANIANIVLPKMQAANRAHLELTNYWVLVVVNPPLEERFNYYEKHRKEFGEFLSTLSERLEATPSDTLQTLYDNLIGSFETPVTPDELENVVEAYGAGVDRFIEEYKEENWNASRLDLAIAWVGQSSNEQLSSAQFSSFSFWLTWAIRAHKNGQLLLGTNFIRPRAINDEKMTKWSGNLRYYVGTQAFRGFLETQYKIEKNLPVEETLLLNLGAELRIGSQFWLSVSGGLNNYLAETESFNKLVSSIEIKYGFNDTNKK